ncbi:MULTISPECIES: hypothetical protein [Novosphingobium]|uniref:hypothetical protein n=1 Tax=Novosphingobium TaxID=165696 RepID=UPI00083051AA|nr:MULTISPECIES: hypothetical protein [Novosphingobium]
MSCPALTFVRKRLAQAPELPWSARHSQQGCQGAREAGAAPPAPHGAAPTPASTVVDVSPRAFPLSDARTPITAVLATFEGEALFHVLGAGEADFKTGDLFRLRRGSRLRASRSAGS